MSKNQVQNNAAEVADNAAAEEEIRDEITFEPEYGDLIPVPGLMVVRETYTKKGKQYYAYRLYATLLGRQTHVDFRMGDDVNAYRLLDLIFQANDALQFAVQPYKSKNQTTKQVRKGYKYYAIYPHPETGLVYKADLKPAQQSDSTILELVLAEVSVNTGISFEA